MNSRNTIQKKLVLDTVRELGCHATAEEIYNKAVTVQPKISKATVYRNLNLLSESGEIRRIEIPSGADRFDHRTDRHFHVRCVRCGALEDAELPANFNAAELIKNAHGFEILDYEIIFKGICPACKLNNA